MTLPLVSDRKHKAKKAPAYYESNATSAWATGATAGKATALEKGYAIVVVAAAVATAGETVLLPRGAMASSSAVRCMNED